MPSVSVPTALIAGTAITAGTGLLNANTSADAAKSAAATQANAANQAAQLQLQEFDQTKASLKPYVDIGTEAQQELAKLTGVSGQSTPGSASPSGGGQLVTTGDSVSANGNPLTGQLTAPFNPTMEQLQQTPGYKFALNQGTQATQNSYAAQGLGQSGAALKGAANYAEGLASTTYQQQFQNYWSQNQSIYNMLSGIGATGENAAAMTGQQGLQATGLANQFSTSGAAATAAGTVGAANAFTGATSNIASSASNNLLLGSLMGQSGNLFGSSNSLSLDAEAQANSDAFYNNNFAL